MLLAFLLLAGCRGDEPKRMPDTLPDVRGIIRDIQRTSENGGEATAVVMVEAVQGIEVRYPKASITIDKSTLLETPEGEPLQLEQLQEGQEVEAWLEGEVMESFPVQAKAKAVRVAM